MLDWLFGRKCAQTALISDQMLDYLGRTMKRRFRVRQDGWIKHDGKGKPPLPENAMIETLHYNGAIFADRDSRELKEWRYGWDGERNAVGIVWFRPCPPPSDDLAPPVDWKNL